MVGRDDGKFVGSDIGIIDGKVVGFDVGRLVVGIEDIVGMRVGREGDFVGIGISGPVDHAPAISIRPHHYSGSVRGGATDSVHFQSGD